MWESPTKGSIIKHKQPEASQQYQKRPPLLTSLLCLSKWKSITFIPILPFCFQLPIIKEDNLAGFDSFALKWRTESVEFLPQKSQVMQTADKIFLLNFTDGDIYQYFSKSVAGKRKSECKFRKKRHPVYFLSVYSKKPSGSKLLFSEQHKISHSSFIPCCRPTSENV